MIDYVPTVCPYCGTGCGLMLEVDDGKLVGTAPLRTHPVSQGTLCIKGNNAHEFVQSDQRLQTPLIRKKKKGPLQEASWDEAIDFVGENLKKIKNDHGADSLAFLSCARATNEENYLCQKFARCVIGTNNVDHCARV